MGRRAWAVLIGGALLVGACNVLLGAASGPTFFSGGYTMTERFNRALDAIAESFDGSAGRTSTCSGTAESGP